MRLLEMDSSGRRREYERIQGLHPNRVPVILRRSETCADLPLVKKNKYLVPRDLAVCEFMTVARRHIQARSDHAVFFYIDSRLLDGNQSMETVRARHASPDGFTYVTYASENAFGCQA